MPGDRIRALHLADRTWARVRARGAGEVVGLAADRLKEAARSGDTLVLLARGADREPSDHDDGLGFRPASSADGELYARDIGTDSKRSFRARLSAATACYVVESGGRLLHSTWVTSSGAWTRELRAYLRPPPGDAYVYESYTHPEARGRGLYPYVLRRIASHAAERGVATLWVAVEADNPASLRAVSKAGFRPVSKLQYGRRWGRVAVQVPTPGEPGSEGPRVEHS